MSLANADWKPVSVHHVIAEFIRSERQTKFASIPAGTVIIDSPNLDDPLENHTRLRLLYHVRAQFLGEIPPDTQWYEVSFLTDGDLDDVHVVAHVEPWHVVEKNRLRDVAGRFPIEMTLPPGHWKRPILWGHGRSGPFSIFEGNHRLIAYASSAAPPGLNISAFIGQSATPCYWHVHDTVHPIANHLWKPGSCWPNAFVV